jgi:hypothetical protein
MGIIGAAIIYHHVQTLHDPIYLALESKERFLILLLIMFGYHLLILSNRFRNNEWWLENCKNNGY